MYYYLIDGCSYASVVGDIEQDETFGVHFNMTDAVPWHQACDTAACLTLDTVDLVFYDVSPANAMNVRIYGADADGEPAGELLGNRDFTPAYTAPEVFATVVVDFTNGGTVEGLDLSSCRGNFVVLVTWKNSTGHPLLVLDNISTPCATARAMTPVAPSGPTLRLPPRRHAHLLLRPGKRLGQDGLRRRSRRGRHLWLPRGLHERGLLQVERCDRAHDLGIDQGDVQVARAPITPS